MRDLRFQATAAWQRGHRCSTEELDKTRAAARQVANGSVDADLVEPGSAGHHPDVWRTFHDEFITAVSESPQLSRDWLAELRRAFGLARASMANAALTPVRGDELAALCAAWSDERDPLSVWSGREPHVAFHDDLWHLAYLMLRIDTDEGLRALETLPCPYLMEQALHLHFVEDREKILEFIRQAPPAYDDAGGWLASRSVTALLAANLIVEHAQALDGALATQTRVFVPNQDERVEAKQALEAARMDELPGWMKSAFAVLLGRKDGRWIAGGYLAHLARRAMTDTTPPRATPKWESYGAALDALATVASSAGVDVSRLRTIWLSAESVAGAKAQAAEVVEHVRPLSGAQVDSRKGEGARTLAAEGLPYLVGAAFVLLRRTSPLPTSELQALWSWLSELVRRRDPGLALLQHGSSLTEVAGLVGGLVSRMPAPGAAVRELYRALEANRRRALYAYRYAQELDHHVGSLLVLRIAFAVCERWRAALADAQSRTAPALDLFYWAFGEARRLWLTAVLDTGRSTKHLVATSFAFMPAIFADELGAALRLTIPPVAGDSRMLAEACVNLRRNGVDAPTILELVAAAGADLPAALTDAHQWSTLTGLREEFPDYLANLAGELGLTLDAPP